MPEMQLTLLKGKIHRATVTDADLNYEGSVGIDAALMKAANILPHEQVDILNINNGERFTTYAIEEQEGSGKIIINGAAARLVQKGDLVILCAFTAMDANTAKTWKPAIIQVDANNKPVKPVNENAA